MYLSKPVKPNGAFTGTPKEKDCVGSLWVANWLCPTWNLTSALELSLNIGLQVLHPLLDTGNDLTFCLCHISGDGFADPVCSGWFAVVLGQGEQPKLPNKFELTIT